MKRLLQLLLVGCLTVGFCGTANAQVQEAEQLALDIQKLAQMKSILTEMYDGYKILTSGYNTVKSLAQGNFNLHQDFLNGLLSVSPTIKKYGRVADIITAQTTLVSEYKTAFNNFKNAQVFSSNELSYINTIFGNLFDQSVDNLDELVNIITDSKLRMSDAERLTAIDHIYDEMTDKISFLRSFSNRTGMLAGQRQKALQENNTLQSLYGH